jgi:5-aminopentanamidase
MRVAAIELRARHGDPAAQLLALDGALASLPRGEPTLAVLPELALTGYVSPRGEWDQSRFAEAIDGPLIRGVAALAAARGVAVLASWVERAGDRCFNSAALIDDRGETALHYRKRHPWIPERWATPGDLGTPVGTLFGRRVAVAVCFDVHFISADAGAVLDSVDALLFPSAWVDDDLRDHRGDLLPSLAARHGCAVVNANWGHGAPSVPGQGASRIVLGDGSTVARAGASPGVPVVTAWLPGRERLRAGPTATKRRQR